MQGMRNGRRNDETYAGLDVDFVVLRRIRREENQQKKEMARLVQIKRKEAIREIREKGLEPM